MEAAMGGELLGYFKKHEITFRLETKKGTNQIKIKNLFKSIKESK